MKLSIPLFLAALSPVFGTEEACPTPNSQAYDLVASSDNTVGSITVTELDMDTLKVCFDLSGDLTPTDAQDDNSPTEIAQASISVGCSASTVTKTVTYYVGTTAACESISKPDCPSHSPVNVEVEAQVNKLGGFEFLHDYFPTRVSYHNYYDGSGGQAASYFDVQFLDGIFSGFRIDSYCIDIGHTIGNQEYTGVAVSAYDENVASIANNVDDATRLPSAAWLLNNYRVGESYVIDYKGSNDRRPLCPKDFPDGPEIPSDIQATLDGLSYGGAGPEEVTINPETLQRALWYLIDNRQSNDGIAGEFNDRLACYIAWESLQNADYEPGCGDLIPIVLVPDPETTTEQQTLTAQTTFAELEIPCDTVTETIELSATFEMTCAPQCEAGSAPVIGAVVGDPHIYTFDGLTNDCQAAGEFVLFKTPGTTRQMQARFEHFTSQGFWSVTKAFAVQDFYDAPKVEIAVPTLETSPVSGVLGACPLMFFVDGVQRDFADGSGKTDVEVTTDGTEATILYDSGLKVTVTTAYANGCFLNLVVQLPCADSSTIGLMGSPNGDALDDWMTPAGTLIEVPTAFGARSAEEGYEYCTTNWCIEHSHHSMLTYAEDDLDFDLFNLCHLPFGGSFMSETPQEVIDYCQGDRICIVDGTAGGLDAAKASVAARAAIVQTKNGKGGECRIALCQDGLSCASMDDGEMQCVEPMDCPACASFTAGPCMNPHNNVCYGLNAEGTCDTGTEMCHHVNISEKTAAAEAATANSAQPNAECGGCWYGTSGPCQAANTVCYALDAHTGQCPSGTSPCEARRRLRGA